MLNVDDRGVAHQPQQVGLGALGLVDLQIPVPNPLPQPLQLFRIGVPF